MPMSFDIRKAKENFLKSSDKSRDGVHVLFVCAGEDAKRIVTMLIEKYQPRRIYQWKMGTELRLLRLIDPLNYF